MEPKATERSDPKSAFAALGLADAVLRVLLELGYEEPTPIQCAAIPPLLEGRDVLGQAATGTGKTAAFALPLLQRLAADDDAKSAARAPRGPHDRCAVRALVLVPTRELAIQVSDALHRYGRTLPGRILAVYGGQPMHQQLVPLRHGVDVVVATPGRALDHIRRGSLRLDAVELVVLDEADEMLDMGFADDLDAILKTLPAERQVALFSATMPRRIAVLAERHLRNPVRIEIPTERVAAGAAPRLRQAAFVVQRREKLEALARVVDFEDPTSVIVFCRTRTEVDEVAEALAARGYRCAPLHGGRTQDERGRVMRRFREGVVNVLVATDVAARGIDVDHITHVINFDVPCSVEAYLHRVGRTGRAGRTGAALTFAEPRERRLIREIEQGTGHRMRIAEVPTLADVHARRLRATGESLRTVLAGGDLEAYRAALAPLASEFDPLDLAAAALKLAHGGATAERPTERGRSGAATAPTPVVGTKVAAASAEEVPAATDYDPTAPGSLPPKNRRERRAAERAGVYVPPPQEPAAAVSSRPSRPTRRPPTAATTHVRIALGKDGGLRPADVVGAIANEAGLAGRSIGSITIGERSTTVEVPASEADNVVRVLNGTTIRGRKVRVDRRE